MNIEHSKLWRQIGTGKRLRRAHCLSALFNVTPDRGFEWEAIDRNIRGIFYDRDSAEVFPKGIRAILKGEWWYADGILPKSPPEADAAVLTDKEKKILTNVARGKTNKAIAKDLGVTVHTVKGHLYKIYKKTNIRNRTQAALLAKKYL